MTYLILIPIICLPALSLGFVLTGLPINNRLLFSFGLATMKIKKPAAVFFPLTFLFSTYFVVSLFLASFNYQLYFANFLSIASLIFAYSLAAKKPDEVILLLRWFLWCNVAYALVQNVLLNAGYGDVSMLHSNDPYQVATNYVPHHFIGPLYRTTGLFNESSPFVIFLSIMFGLEYELRKSVVNFTIPFLCIFILLSGAKIGIAFFIIFMVLRGGTIVRILGLTILGAVLTSFFLNPALFGLLFLGRAGSIYKRLNEFNATREQGFSWFGNGLQSSSAGDVGLDAISILVTGYGFIGLAIVIITFLWLFWSHRKVGGLAMLSAFICAFVSSGSLLIVQYLIMVCCLGALRKKDQNA